MADVSKLTAVLVDSKACVVVFERDVTTASTNLTEVRNAEQDTRTAAFDLKWKVTNLICQVDYVVYIAVATALQRVN